MQPTNILWRGIEYDSMENCLIAISADSIAISSAIVGSYEQRLYRAEYELELDTFWNIRTCFVRSQVGSTVHSISCIRMDEQWFVNGVHLPDLDLCADIDIPITPLTNSLPINRLKLSVGETKQICVVYIDLFTDRIRPATQLYHRVSQNVYHYENVPNDFEAQIRVDDSGFVTDYPKLFKRQ